MIDVKVGQKMSTKLLQFCENHRPAYYGTWRKISRKLSARNPFAKDEVNIHSLLVSSPNLMFFRRYSIMKLKVTMNGKRKNLEKASPTLRCSIIDSSENKIYLFFFSF